MTRALLIGAGLGALVVILAPIVWRHRQAIGRRMLELPAVAWLIVGLGALAALWYSRGAGGSAPPMPPPPVPPRAPDHAEDLPVDTLPDPAAPLAPDPALADDELLRWLEQRARRRAGTSE